MQKVKILKLSPEDAQLLQKCAELEKICIPEEAWSLESFRSEAGKPSGFVLAALEENRKLAGFLTASCILDTADLTNIAVAPEYRRRGIAGLLLKKLCAEIGKVSRFSKCGNRIFRHGVFIRNMALNRSASGKIFISIRMKMQF